MLYSLKKIIQSVINSPLKLTLFNVILISVIVIGNALLQVFCIPVLWAAVVLGVCFIVSILNPILETKERLAPALGFINGVSTMVFLYCILFLEEMNIFGLILILLLGLGLLVYIPHYFIIQLFWKSIIKPKYKRIRIWYIMGISVSVIIAVISINKYKTSLQNVNNYVNGKKQELELDYFTERILGEHFIYHTRLESYYDGWRPPFHDSLFVLGLRATDYEDPLRSNTYHILPSDLIKRIELYKRYYPDNTIKYECSCAKEYDYWYHGDDLWKKAGVK